MKQRVILSLPYDGEIQDLQHYKIEGDSKHWSKSSFLTLTLFLHASFDNWGSANYYLTDFVPLPATIDYLCTICTHFKVYPIFAMNGR